MALNILPCAVEVKTSTLKFSIIRHSGHFDSGIFSKETAVNTPDFADRRVFLVAPNDSRVARYYKKPETVTCDVEQSCSGPIYLVIGAAADNELLSRAANRFGMPISGLLKHRDRLIEINHPSIK